MASDDGSIKEAVITIKVFGVGGGGNSVLKRIAEGGFADVELVAVNTDATRDLIRRSDENARYFRIRERVLSALRVRKEQWVQRKDYKFFVCPACKATLRVPKGRGKIKIVCRKCGNSFMGKS